VLYDNKRDLPDLENRDLNTNTINVVGYLVKYTMTFTGLNQDSPGRDLNRKPHLDLTCLLRKDWGGLLHTGVNVFAK
jgi:hypothetical protein